RGWPRPLEAKRLLCDPRSMHLGNLRSLPSLSLTLLFAAGCGQTPATDGGNADYQVRESVEQLQVTHAPPGETLLLIDSTGAQVATGVTDGLGSYIFRHVAPGTGYLVRNQHILPVQNSRKL